MLLLEKRKSQINNTTFYLKKLEKEKIKITVRDKVIKRRAEINKIRRKNDMGKSVKQKTGPLKRSVRLTNPSHSDQKKEKRNKLPIGM